MKRSSTDRLLTWNFLRMCIAHFLLFASLYVTLPLLPLLVEERTGSAAEHGVWIYGAFAAGMLAVGPFHAHLGDEFRRKLVFVWSLLLSSMAVMGYLYADSFWQMVLLALWQGAGFALAVVGSLTVAIDITPSARRSAGNLFYVWMARMGMMVGAWGGVWLYILFGPQIWAYVAAGLSVPAMLLGAGVYLPFRAPIGVPVCTMDRFLLPRAWVPALGLTMLSMVAGLLMPLLATGDECPLMALGLLALLSVPLTRLFVRLSHHCQRGTANATCYLSTEVGVMMGMVMAYRETDAASLHRDAVCWGILAMLFFVLAVYPYFRVKKVR